MGCGKHIPEVTVFDSKEFYDKVLEDPAYKEEWDLPIQMPDEINCLIYKGTTFTYDGSAKELGDSSNSRISKISDSVYAYSPVTLRTYNLNALGWRNIVLDQPDRGGAVIWKFRVWSAKTHFLMMLKARD
jgi:hypothetical protein